MKNCFAAILAVAVLACLPVCAKAETYVLPGIEKAAPSTTLKIVDERPGEQRATGDSQLSYLVTSCSYGIYRLADTITAPHKLELLRMDLEKSLGSQLNDKTLTVWSYAIYRNSGNVMRGTALAIGIGGAIGGLVGAVAAPEIGSGCASEETPEGWYDPSEANGRDAPLIVQIGARMDGRNYAVRAVLAHAAGPLEQAFADLLHRANTGLAEKIRVVSASVTGAAVNTASPFGIKSAGTVTSASITAVYFRNDPHGVAIGALEPNGAAAQAGIHEGDVITDLNGKRIETMADFRALVSGAAGSDAKVQLNRSGENLTVQVHL